MMKHAVGVYSLVLSALIAFAGESVSYRVVDVGPYYFGPYAVGDVFSYVGRGDGFDDYGDLHVNGRWAALTRDGFENQWTGDAGAGSLWDGGRLDGWYYDGEDYVTLSRVSGDSISGFVTVNGSPATNAVVGCWRSFGWWWEPVSTGDLIRVASDGSYRIPVLPAGEYALSAFIGSDALMIEYPFSNTVVFSGLPLTHVDLNINVLQPPVSKSYRVVELGPYYFGPYAVGDVFSYVGRGDGFDDYGDLHVNGRWVSLSRDGYENQWTAAAGGGLLWDGGRLDGWYFDGEDFIVLERITGAGISGRVTVGGVGASNAVVLVCHDTGWGWVPVGSGDPLRTSSDGSYSLSGLSSGDYRVAVGVISDGFYIEYPLTNVISVADREIQNIDLHVIRDLSITGHISPAYRLPLSGLRVSVWKRSVTNSWTAAIYPPGYSPLDPSTWGGVVAPRLIPDGGWFWSVTGNQSLITDDSGNFILSGLDAGDYMLEITDPAGNFLTTCFYVTLNANVDRSFYVPYLDWISRIPLGEIWITSISVSGGVVTLTINNCDPDCCYFIYQSSELITLKDKSGSRQFVGMIFGVSGEGVVTVPVSSGNRFFCVESQQLLD